MDKKRVLQAVVSLNGGGVGAVILNYYKNLTSEFVFDAIVNNRTFSKEENVIEERGGNIYEVHPFSYGKIRYFKELIAVLWENRSSVIHCNLGEKSFFFLLFAKLFGYKKRILHVHSSVRPESHIQQVIRTVLTRFCIWLSTDYVACGVEAAKWNYGSRIDNCVVLKNAIDIESYKYNEDLRRLYRDKYQLGDKLVIGSVGRLSFPKNHKFMLNVFKEFLELNPNSVLLLAGCGELEEEIKEQIKALEIEESVMMIGLCPKVNELLSTFDLFLMPSISEGVPVAAIEALANGLTVVCSDAVTKEIFIEDKVHYLSLEVSAKDWATYINSLRLSRTNLENNLSSMGYSIKQQVTNIKKLYS